MAGVHRIHEATIMSRPRRRGRGSLLYSSRRRLRLDCIAHRACVKAYAGLSTVNNNQSENLMGVSCRMFRALGTLTLLAAVCIGPAFAADSSYTPSGRT